MFTQSTNSFAQKLVFGACMTASAVGFQALANGKEPENRATATATLDTDIADTCDTKKELAMPSFPTVEVTPETLRVFATQSEIQKLIDLAEPQLRGERVVLALVDQDGNVIEGREVVFPAQQQENTKLLWGLFVTGLIASATLSGLTIGLFSISKLQLTLLSEQGCEDAKKILGLREDANTVLSTLIWGNVGLNVLISKIGDQAMSASLGALGAAIFSIGAITVFGEILPQAYFTQNVLKAGARLEPVVKALRFLLYPVAKPSGVLMDKLVGREGLEFYKEKELTTLLSLSARHNPEITSHTEAQGAINFMGLDDLSVMQEGELISSASILTFPLKEDGNLDIPDFKPVSNDPFLQAIQAAEYKWVILCDPQGNPQQVLDADSFLRDVLFEPAYTPVHTSWHKPLVIRDKDTKLGDVLPTLSVEAEHPDDDVVDRDIILVWTPEEKRIITGSDLLGRLLRGIVHSTPKQSA
jgi:metal transporter CNNM